MATRDRRPSRREQFEIVVSPRARRDLLAIREYIAQNSPLNADRFIQRVIKTIDKLAIMPRGRPMALESQEVGGEVRQSVAGPYRIVFEVVGHRVVVHTVRHSAREPLRDL